MQGLMQRIGTTCDATKKGTLLALHLKKKTFLGYFFKFSTKGNKVNSGTLEKPDAVWTQN